MNSIEYFWKVHMMPILIMIMGFILCSLTLLVVFLELSLFFAWDQSNESSFLSTWTSFSESNKSQSFFIANLVCFIPLSYICASSYFGLFSIKVQSMYALHAKH